MPKRLLVVEPDPAYASHLAGIADRAGWTVTSRTCFASARRELLDQSYDAITGNIRLGGFNGIHLAYVARHGSPESAVILYSASHDPVLVREANLAGAFYEPMELLIRSLPSYLAASLPSGDRRRGDGVDRRQTIDGGRRTTDVVTGPQGDIGNSGVVEAIS